MFGKILKGLAVAAGVGLAIGLGSGSVGLGKRRRVESPKPVNPPEDLRLRKRLDLIESRIDAVETRPLPAAAAELDLRIEVQAKDLDALRLLMNEYRQRIAGDVAAIEQRLADVTKGIPAMLESIVTPRVDDLRLHLRSETQQSLSTSLTTFERAIDDKVSGRIASIEKALLDQSTLVTVLSQRAIESEMNLQRLISAVERLCDRPGLGSGTRAVAA